MVPLTRRHLLQGAAVLSAGLAGCTGSSTSSSRSSPPTDAENVELDPDSAVLRNAGNDPVVWTGSRPTATPRSETNGGRPITDRETGLIASDEDAADLTLGDVAGIDDAWAFVEATDFETETLLLETRPVEECYRLDLCAVTWSASSYHTYFGRTLRPADVACRTDVKDRVAHLVRIPDTLDPSEITSRGSGSSSRGCEAFRHRFERELDRRSEAGTDE